eukprot:CAMPEP_0197582898 /NCGR_PEP_ID=MMETSP1326-20131121/5982_1 /TAXON_ID=1155430 /ORGANISM="Genus nov. species nov., Strain RCC2288" /LENGTH=129 /DNA_ID=CAMNT_0043147045 /DNA_START=236 /DNA_END=622 /DNA_ORIENTATION=-
MNNGYALYGMAMGGTIPPMPVPLPPGALLPQMPAGHPQHPQHLLPGSLVVAPHHNVGAGAMVAAVGRAEKSPARACTQPGCNFTTNQGRARLEKHIATHSAEKPFKCEAEACTKAFKTAELLKQHGRCH